MMLKVSAKLPKRENIYDCTKPMQSVPCEKLQNSENDMAHEEEDERGRQGFIRGLPLIVLCFFFTMISICRDNVSIAVSLQNLLSSLSVRCKRQLFIGSQLGLTMKSLSWFNSCLHCGDASWVKGHCLACSRRMQRPSATLWWAPCLFSCNPVGVPTALSSHSEKTRDSRTLIKLREGNGKGSQAVNQAELIDSQRLLVVFPFYLLFFSLS